MKIIIAILLLLCIAAPCSAELTPEIFDTYFLYSGMGENQTSKYIFHSSQDVVGCEMVPQNDSVRCMIDEGYIIEVWFTTAGESYFGELQVTNVNGTTASSTLIVRTHDFGSHSEIMNIPVGGLANISEFNLFFNTKDENVTGIRNWLTIWLVILFVFGAAMSFRK